MLAAAVLPVASCSGVQIAAPLIVTTAGVVCTLYMVATFGAEAVMSVMPEAVEKSKQIPGELTDEAVEGLTDMKCLLHGYEALEG